MTAKVGGNRGVVCGIAIAAVLWFMMFSPWTAPYLNFWIAIAVSIIGNLIPVPFIIIFIKKIFTYNIT